MNCRKNLNDSLHPFLVPFLLKITKQNILSCPLLKRILRSKLGHGAQRIKGKSYQLKPKWIWWIFFIMSPILLFAKYVLLWDACTVHSLLQQNTGTLYYIASVMSNSLNTCWFWFNWSGPVHIKYNAPIHLVSIRVLTISKDESI